ncbi:MAG: hypothetical protein NTZ85_13410 [Bacteroidia bacterium]|nr:hypothetical protein [Bacteroidia bacterium]
MKRIIKNLLLILMIGSIPLSMAFGQEKKTEQKVKIVTVDKSGTKTVIDTTFTAGSKPDSIILKNGEVIYLAHPEKGLTISKSAKAPGKVTVTVTDDNEGEKKNEERVIIMSGDDAKWSAASTSASSTGEGKKQVYVYANAESTGDKPVKKIIITSDDDGDLNFEGEKVIIVKDGKVIKSDGGETFDIRIEKKDDIESDADVTKYVVAKDGLVITVEGKDEAKVKEIMKVIEGKLDVKAEGGEKREVVKTETKKTEKK